MPVNGVGKDRDQLVRELLGSHELSQEDAEIITRRLGAHRLEGEAGATAQEAHFRSVFRDRALM